MKSTSSAGLFLRAGVVCAVIAAASQAFAGVASASGLGTVTLTFDDGNPSQYEIPAQIVKAAGGAATFYINSGLLGTDEWYMTWDQVIDLHTAGFEIAAHTLNHLELPAVNNATKSSEITQDYTNFVAHGITPTNFAVPFGAYDNTTTALVAAQYNSLRAFANQGLNVWPYNKYLLYVRYVTNQTSLEQVEGWVDEAVAQDGWLILVFHEVLPVVDPTDDYSWETAKFQAFMDYLDARQIQTKTVEEVLNQFTSVNANPSFEDGFTGWTTDNPSGVVLDGEKRGSYPAPKYSAKMTGGRRAAHLFGQKIPVAPSAVYGLRAYTDSRTLRAGEVGFYIDEYDQWGNWVSGKWLGGFTNKNVIDKSFVYRPTSGSVTTAAPQVYMTAGASGSVFVDNVEFYARAENPNLVANPSFEDGFTGWTTDSATGVVLDAGGNGGSPHTEHSIKMTGGAQSVHLFGGQIPVSYGTPFGLRAYLDSRGLSAGEVGFYIDEYDQWGTWVSGKWLGAALGASAENRSYLYTPTAENVITAAVQVYLTAGASGSVFVDNIGLSVR